MKKFILIALVLASSACSGLSAIIPTPGPIIGPVLPHRPQPGLRHVTHATCTGTNNEYCLKNLQAVTSRTTGGHYAFACPVRGTPSNGEGLIPVPISATSDGRPGKILKCAETLTSTELGFKAVKKGDSVSVAYVLLDGESGQYVIDRICSYTMFRNRVKDARSGATCS